MATSVNILSDTDGLYAVLRVSNSTTGGSSVSGSSIALADVTTNWVVTGATASVITTEFLVNTRFVLRVAPSGAGIVTIGLSGIPLVLADNGRVLSFNCKMKSTEPFTGHALLSIDGQPAGGHHDTTETASGVYAAVHSNTTIVPDDGVYHTATVHIEITDHGGQNIFMTLPNLIDDQRFYDNLFVAGARQFMPDFYWERDSQQSYPTAPFHRFIDCLFSSANEAHREYKKLLGHEVKELVGKNDFPDEDKFSVLTDVRVLREKYVNWLSQFTGARLARNLTDGTGANHFENAGTQREFIDAQLNGAFYGYAAGTRKSIYNAVRQVLKITTDGAVSTQVVGITPHYNNDTWSILVRTLTNETPDAIAGEESQLVLNAVEPARPLGYTIYHLTVDAFYFTLGDSAFGRLDEMPLG